jgi:hypothetical protein
MSDITTKMGGGKSVESNQASVISKAPPCTQSACGGEGAATMRMPEIDVRELSDEMLIFMLQLMAPEKYGKAAPFGKDAETGRPGDAERMGESKQSSVIGNQSAADEAVALGADAGSGGGRSERPGLATGGTPPFAQSDCDGEEGDCPQISQRDADSGHSPAPKFEPSLDLRKSASSADTVRSDGEEVPETPESRSGFVPQTAGGELHMPQDCPEIHWGKAKGSKLNAKVRNNEDFAGSASDGEAVQQRAEIRDQRSEKMTETPESSSGFIPQSTGDEGLMPRDCPEFINQTDLATSGSPATSVTPPSIQSACGGGGYAAEGRDPRSKVRRNDGNFAVGERFHSASYWWRIANAAGLSGVLAGKSGKSKAEN